MFLKVSLEKLMEPGAFGMPRPIRRWSLRREAAAGASSRTRLALVAQRQARIDRQWQGMAGQTSGAADSLCKKRSLPSERKLSNAVTSFFD